MEFLSDDDDNIWTAASDGELDKVKQFIASSNGALNVNSQDENGYSPLHAAVSYGHVELAAWLLDNGANLNIADIDGDTPLLYCEDIATLEFLMSRGADLTQTNNSGETLVTKCIEDENEDLINYIIARGVGIAQSDIPNLKFFAQSRNEEFTGEYVPEEGDENDDEEN